LEKIHRYVNKGGNQGDIKFLFSFGFKHDNEGKKFAKSRVRGLPNRYGSSGVVVIILQVGACWVWSLIIFLISKVLFHPGLDPRPQ
jgi:hypothetical protein